ncbi:MAG: hypothetical protein AAGH40_09270 [Verrucomicrobiota bacterium]
MSDELPKSNSAKGEFSDDSLSTREIAKLELEISKLDLENKELSLRLAGQLKPSRWEIIRLAVAWVGIVVPITISIFTLLAQRDQSLRQQEIEARDRRLTEIKDAIKHMESIDRSAGILSLSAYGDDALPRILGEIKGVDKASHWPSSTLAAITSLQKIGKSSLSTIDINYLIDQGELGVDQLERTPEQARALEGMIANNPAKLRYELTSEIEEANNIVKVLRAMLQIVEPQPAWTSAIEKYEKWEREVNFLSNQTE